MKKKPTPQWSLSELQALVDPIVNLGSGAMLLAGTVLAREMNLDELQRLTDSCLREERLKTMVRNPPDENA